MKAILSIATTTVGEAIRRKVLLVILLIGVILLILCNALPGLTARSETTILRSMMLGAIQMTSAVIAVILTVYMIPNEIERRTIYTILSKPVQRWQFLVGKYLGAVFALALMMAMMSAIMVVLFWLYQHADASALATIAKAPLMFFVQMCLLAAVGMLFSTFVSPLVNFFLSGGLYILGTVFNPFMQAILENSKTSPVFKGLAQIVNVLLPNFATYNVQNPIINPGQTIGNETTYYLNATVYGVFYIGITLIIGILVFDRREV